MNHPDEDTLLKYVLEVLDTSDARELKGHLDACASCRLACDTIERQVRQLGTVSFPIETPDLPLPASTRRPYVLYVLRAAAILLVGFVLGYTTALMREPEMQVVISQQFRPTAPRVSVSHPLPCEQVDIGRHRVL
ncbi:MAG: hypothetical protein H6Q31_1599 [Bacteroidetes bacterium]|jgi:hypothetical protein|nr:hypothetical protein [Bacteroidota bacterium]